MFIIALLHDFVKTMTRTAKALQNSYYVGSQVNKTVRNGSEYFYVCARVGN